jgi:excisionase family DNA binding protein
MSIEASDQVAPERRAFRVSEFCRAYGVSASTTYKLIREGKLRSVLVCGRRLIPRDAAEKLISGSEPE